MTEPNYNNIENNESNNIHNILTNSDKQQKDKKLHTRTCPYCKQEYQTKIGLDNWKNLFRKPTLDDFIVLVILILLMLAAFAYISETAQCRETLKNLDTICMQRSASLTQGLPGLTPGLNPNFTYTIPNKTDNIYSNNVSNVSE